ncbi:hypothetical protein Gorai_019703 [Gossypium raimondii]|uniref:DUF4283 domain-containing protein n=1 Tax=Gossypium raimondii TaxID=29730 RepID=A0A7J8PP04_GOSRA|nr:hypothetical protein [Gossypium raimondii]
MEFNLFQPFPTMVMAWIRLQGLPNYLYNKKILEEIGDLIGKIAKLDFNTDNQLRGYFARLALDGPHWNAKETYKLATKFSISGKGWSKFMALSMETNRKGEKKMLDNEEVGLGNVGRESLIGFGSESYQGSCWKGKIEVGAKAILVRVQLALGQGLNLVKAIGNRLFTTSIKTITMEQGIEKNLNNCKERPINVGDFHLNATSHFNPTFKGLIELEISLNSNMLDPSKYTTVVFKDNLGDNTTTFLGVVI